MRFIKLDENGKVISVRLGSTVVAGEIQSNNGEVGQIRQADGIFITPQETPQQDKDPLQEIKDNQIVIMDAIAQLYEDGILNKGV